MKDFKQVAIDTSSLSPLMKNRTKISTSEIINNFSSGLTVVAFDLINLLDKKTGGTKSVSVVLFKELPDKFYFGSKILTNICENWLIGYESEEAASNDLASAGGVKICIERRVSNDGNNVNLITVL